MPERFNYQRLEFAGTWECISQSPIYFTHRYCLTMEFLAAIVALEIWAKKGDIVEAERELFHSPLVNS